MIFGHSSFDTNLLNAEVTKSGIYKWTNGSWDDGEDPNWATDSRTWQYDGYTIAQSSMKQDHINIGEMPWWK